MINSSPAKTRSRATRRRAGLLVLAVAFALASYAATACSALAQSWWVEEPPKPPTEPVELESGKQLFLGSAAKVNQAFTLKWKQKFEISCGGEVSYKNLYLEGHLGIGMEGIDFGKCTAKKPKGMTLIGGEVETLPLAGTVTPNGSKFPFTLSPKTAAVASFQLEREVKPRKHYKSATKKLCKYHVEAIGKLEGELGEKPEVISKEKTLDFASKDLKMKSTKECESVMAVVKPSAKPLGAAKSLLLKTKAGPLKAGQELEAFSSNLVLTSEAGSVECTESTLTGVLDTNNSKTDLATFNEAESEGTVVRECKSTAPTGPVFVEWKGLPWSAAFSPKGAGLLTGPIAVTLESEEGLKCTFEPQSPGLKFTNSVSGPATITFTSQGFDLPKGASQQERELCPKHGSLSGVFLLTSEGEPVEVGPGVTEKEHKEEQEEAKEEAEELKEEEAGLPLEGNKGKLGYSGTTGWGLL